jgi:tripartite-type tricarboxylate transporter receptor subunit TctC
LAAWLFLAPAWSQSLPAGTITMIVPFSAGGGTDAVARAFAEHLRVSLQRPIVATNVVGAGGSIGMSRLMHVKPDGLTIAIGSTSANIPLQNQGKVLYDPQKDLAPIGQMTTLSHILAVNRSKLPDVDNVAKLIDYLKKHPGEVSYGSPGIGTGHHLAAELFQQMTGTRMLHVPYPGSSQVVVALLGGQVDLAFDTGAVLLPQIKAGKLLPLAWTGRTRPYFDTNLPTIGETVPGYARVAGLGLFAAAGTPADVVTLYSKELQAFAAKPETVAAFRELGFEAVFTTPDQFREEIKNELDRISKIKAGSGGRFD